MRTTRRALIAAGSAVVAAAAVAAAIILPGSLHSGGQPATHGSPLPSGGATIAAGHVGGRPWRITLEPAGNKVCAAVAGSVPSCVDLRQLGRLRGPVTLSGTEVAVPGSGGSKGPPEWNALFGAVRSGVTRITFRTSTGKTYAMHPVRAAGRRWVGVVLPPAGVGQLRAVAYAGRTELAYSVPFIGGELRPGTYFLTWLRPGQRGPAQATRYIATVGSGATAWGALVLAGPWGYCVSLEVPVANGAKQDCFSAGSLRDHVKVITRWGPPPAVPRWIFGTAGPGVAYLRLTLTGGPRFRVPVPEVSGQPFYAMEIRPGPAIAGWNAFDAAGHRLDGGRGAPGAHG
jgi:hypothetical protein